MRGMRTSTRAFLFAALLFAAPRAAFAASSGWNEIKSEHFTVISNASDNEARLVAWQFEQVRQALRAIWPWAAIDGGRPFLIFAVKDEPTLRTLGPQYWEGKQFRPASFWVDGVDRQFVGMRTNISLASSAAENPYQSAYFSYISAILLRTFPGNAPSWFTRGVSEVLSNTIVADKELQIGRVMDRHLDRLREGAFIPMEEFLYAKNNSKWLTGEAEIQLFDAQAWLFVHYLMYGDKAIQRPRLNRFAQLLHEGQSAAAAQNEAFGTMTPYMSLMSSYKARGVFQYARVVADVKVAREGFTARTLGAAESALERAHFLVAMDRPQEARALAREAIAADPSSPAADEVEATLSDFAGKRDDARAALERAAAKGSKRGHTYFRLAQIAIDADQNSKPVLEKAAADLEKAARLDPWHATTLSLLSLVKADLGRPEEAVGLAQKAIALEPTEPFHYIQMARALNLAGSREEALATARTAVRISREDADRESAQDFLNWLSRPVSAQTAARPTRIDAGVTAQETTIAGDLKNTEADDTIDACLNERKDQACAKAIPFLQQKCNEKSGHSCRALGSLYDGGFGVPPDKGRAAQAHDAGCRAANDKGSCARYAVLQVEGFGVEKNEAFGLKTLQTLCGEKVADACIGWGLLLSRPPARDLPKARALLQTECDAKNDEACRLLKALPTR